MLCPIYPYSREREREKDCIVHVDSDTVCTVYAYQTSDQYIVGSKQMTNIHVQCISTMPYIYNPHHISQTNRSATTRPPGQHDKPDIPVWLHAHDLSSRSWNRSILGEVKWQWNSCCLAYSPKPLQKQQIKNICILHDYIHTNVLYELISLPQKVVAPKLSDPTNLFKVCGCWTGTGTSQGLQELFSV